MVPDNLRQNARLGDDHPNALVVRLVAAVVDTWRGFEDDRVHGVTRRRRRLVAHRTPRAGGRVDEATAVARPQPLRAPEHPVVGQPRASLTWQSAEHLSVASPWASTWVYLRVRAVSGFSTRCQVRVECESLGACLRVTSARLSVARWLNGAKLGRTRYFKIRQVRPAFESEWTRIRNRFRIPRFGIWTSPMNSTGGLRKHIVGWAPAESCLGGRVAWGTTMWTWTATWTTPSRSVRRIGPTARRRRTWSGTPRCSRLRCTSSTTSATDTAPTV